MKHSYDRLFLYGLLTSLFREPDADLMQLLGDEEMDILRDYLPSFPDPPLKPGINGVELENLIQAYKGLVSEVPMRASAYREREGDEMATLYQRMGLEPDLDSPPIDLLSMELELVVLLADLEADAEDGGREGEVERCRAWHRVVVDEHIKTWAPLWIRRARESDPVPFYRWAIDLLEQILDRDKELLN